MHALLSTVLIVGCVVTTQAAKLPSFVKPCYRDDPTFNACALTNGRAALPRLVQGYRKLHLPVLDPLAIEELRLDKAATKVGLQVTMRNIVVTGLKTATLEEINVDLDAHHFHYKLSVPRLEILHTYDITGRILVIPIAGEGPGNVTLSDVVLTFDADYDVTERANGKEYIKLQESKVLFDTGAGHVKLDNLFNGDKLLGETMNTFLNEHWKDLMSELGPIMAETLGVFSTQLFNNLADQVPYDEVAPLKA